MNFLEVTSLLGRRPGWRKPRKKKKKKPTQLPCNPHSQCLPHIKIIWLCGSRCVALACRENFCQAMCLDPLRARGLNTIWPCDFISAAQVFASSKPTAAASTEQSHEIFNKKDQWIIDYAEPFFRATSYCPDFLDYILIPAFKLGLL